MPTTLRLVRGVEARRRPGEIRQPRRRRVLPVNADPVILPPPLEEGPRPVEPARRRALTEDNISVPLAGEADRPDLPVRAQSLIGAPSTGIFAADETNGDDDESTDQPPQLLRGMVGDALHARRTLEEGFREEVVDAPLDDGHGNTPLQPHPTDDVPWPPFPHLAAGDASDSDTEPSPRRDNHSEAASDDIFPLDPLPGVVRARPHDDGIDIPIVGNQGEELPPIPADWQSWNSDDGTGLLTPVASEDSDSNHDAQTPDAAPVQAPPPDGDEQAEEEVNEAEVENPATPEDPEHPTLLKTIAAWFWDVDAAQALQENQNLPVDDEHIIADLNAEAPFVPVPNRGFAVLPQGLVDPPRDEQVPLPGQDGVNPPLDANAVEDAEELEGMLELIGMEGPVVGMVQNVVFSLLLISLTLAASVWIPYIWGKIALILLANPVSVVIKAPIYLVSHFADLVADICFFILGLLALAFNTLAKFVKLGTEPIAPQFSNLLDTDLFEKLAINVTHQSGSRLEKTLVDTLNIFSPDLPTFSTQSHRALTSFKSSVGTVYDTLFTMIGSAVSTMTSTSLSLSDLRSKAVDSIAKIPQLPRHAKEFIQLVANSTKSVFVTPLKPLSTDTASFQDLELVEWSTQDKIIAIVLGYIFFGLAGFLFMKAAHLFLGLKKDEKVQGSVADGLRQAGGVVKVIVIIGIEMIVFPLYCGLLLDLALLPLFEGATVQTRLAFIGRAPFTGLFLHWFAGTCYMFHFALFVSMCRKILRKGVLYFIRDPDDPTFHPVRDVLERPVPTQLGKIAFSALVYGGLVIMCLGGVVWGVGCFKNVLPVRWATPEPRLAFPVDVIFFNFMVPFIIRNIELSKKVSAVYEWWFRGVAHGLRLTHFFFGDEREDEKRPRIRNGILSWYKPGVETPAQQDQDGIYVRAPASDSCRVPKNHKVFVEVTKDNKRVDGRADHRHGLHGKKNKNFAKIWLPPHFKARITTFVVLLWLFAAGTGVACTIGPLLVGRHAVQLLSGSKGPVNDLYALTVGLHTLGGSIYVSIYAPFAFRLGIDKARQHLPNPMSAAPQVWTAIKYAAGLGYLMVSFGIIFPFTLSLISELYIHIPIFTFLFDRESFLATTTSKSDAQIISAATTLTESASAGLQARQLPSLPPTIFVLQTWTLGLLYLRLGLRIALNYPDEHTRISLTIRAIVRKGIWRPDVRLATRAIIMPLTLLCVSLLAAPLGYARFILAVGRVAEEDDKTRVYRAAYPGLLGLVMIGYFLWVLKKRLEAWRVRVRDEVYLVGERLHNYASHAVEKKDKGKGKAIEAVVVPDEEETPPVDREAVAANGILLDDW